LKILMATHYFGSHNGGIEIVAEELFRQFSKRGLEIAWAAGNTTSPPEAIGTSSTIRLPISNFVEEKIGLPFPIPGLKAIGQLRAAVKNADVVILHDCLYLSNIVTFLLARRRGAPTVIVQHIGAVPYKNPVLNGMMRLANRVVTRPMLARAGQVVFISETTKTFFRDVDFRRSPELVFNGVDTDLYRPPESAARKAELRRKYELPERGRVVLFVGRFVEKKGLAILKEMAARRPEYTWAFAGWGPLDPRGWNASNARVYSGLRGASMAELYQACDVFVLPSTGEGFPLVIQEALAVGMPVLCSAETATADASLGHLVRTVPIRDANPGESIADFLAALDELFAANADSSNASATRRVFAENRYSWATAADRYLEIAQRLCQSEASASVVLDAGTEKAPR